MQRFARGFTLIEILVVLAVIATLVAMLLPTLATTRENARGIRCAANMKQLGMAFQMYAGDYDGVWPAPGGYMGDRNYWHQDHGGGLEPYLNNAGSGLHSVWVCPSWGQGWGSPYRPRTYGMNTALRNPPDVFPWGMANTVHQGLSPSQLVDPAQTILLFEGIPDLSKNDLGYVGRCGYWDSVKGYDRYPNVRWAGHWLPHQAWHSGGNNYLFCDGHVKRQVPKKAPWEPSAGDNQWFVAKWR